MSSNTKYLHIKSLFKAHANPEKAEQEARYMRNQFKFYGMQTPTRRSLYKDFLKQEKKNGSIDWELLDVCYADEYREFQYLVTDYLRAFQDKLVYEDIPKILNYIKQKQRRDTIDTFDRIVGKIGLRDERVDALMLKRSQDEDFWIRRIAIDHQLNRKKQTNTKLLAQIIINNFGSDEFFINKAIGRSLREYAKTNPLWVRKFIEKYNDKMNTLSIREASKYLF